MTTESNAVHDKVWTRRERLTFPGLNLEVDYTLPLFVPKGDDIFVADMIGKRAASCKDSLYESIDMELLWLDKPTLYVYCESEQQQRAASTSLRLADSLERPEDVLHLADFFRDSQDDILSRWQLRARSATARNRISTEDLETIDRGTMSVPACGTLGQALKVDPAAGYISLVRSPIVPLKYSGGRLHLRAHFFDDGMDYTAIGHWLGIKSSLGSAALGIAFGLDGSYSFGVGDVPTGESGKVFGWLRTFIDRKRGWHLLEILIEHNSVSFCIDEEDVGSAKAEGSSDVEEVWLVSRCGGCGVWAGVELFHTPGGRHGWENCPGNRRPWRVISEQGRWQADDQGIMRDVQFREGSVAQVTAFRQQLIDAFLKFPEYSYIPQMDHMLGKQYKVLTVNPDGMVGLKSLDGSNNGIWWFPPVAAALVVIQPESVLPAPSNPQEDGTASLELVLADSQATLSAVVPAELDGNVVQNSTIPDALPTTGGLAIECWSIAGEDDLARMERVMTVFVDALRAAEVTMPDNIHRIEQCRAPQHNHCFIYSFGTRRLHVATRATREGRLLLVVRCGGGFLDFIEFARRYGSLEQIRLQKKPDAQGREVVRVTSVLSKGRLRAITRPNTSCGSFPASPAGA